MAEKKWLTGVTGVIYNPTYRGWWNIIPFGQVLCEWILFSWSTSAIFSVPKWPRVLSKVADQWCMSTASFLILKLEKIRRWTAWLEFCLLNDARFGKEAKPCLQSSYSTFSCRYLRLYMHTISVIIHRDTSVKLLSVILDLFVRHIKGQSFR